MAEPNFYAIIPSDVRYDRTLCANAKLLFGEITALANKEGFCWASNEYFAKLYEVDKNTISRWVSSLRSQGYIEVEITDRVNRKIYLADSRFYKKDFKDIQKDVGGSTKRRNQDLQKEGHINTVNITNNTTRKEEARAEIPEQPKDPFMPVHNFEGSEMVHNILHANSKERYKTGIASDPSNCNAIYQRLISDDKESELKQKLLEYEFSWWKENGKLPSAKNVAKAWDQLTPDKIPYWIRDGHETETAWKTARQLKLDEEKEARHKAEIVAKPYNPMEDPLMIEQMNEFEKLRLSLI